MEALEPQVLMVLLEHQVLQAQAVLLVLLEIQAQAEAQVLQV